MHHNNDLKREGKRRTYPYILGVLLLLWFASFVPHIHDLIIALDYKTAVMLNSLVGRNIMADLMLGGLNSKAGDKTIILIMMAFFLLHSFRFKDVDIRCRRLSFWLWMLLLFIGIYQGQRLLEGAFDRDSPSKVIDDWHNIQKMYDIHAKVSNTRSFPSGHASAYYFMALMALRTYRTVGWGLMLVALILPTTRIMTGAHWLSDILLGSVPISILFSALAYETFIYKLRMGLYFFLRDIYMLLLTRKNRSLGNRLRHAWKEFVSPEAGMVRGEEPPE